MEPIKLMYAENNIQVEETETKLEELLVEEVKNRKTEVNTKTLCQTEEIQY